MHGKRFHLAHHIERLDTPERRRLLPPENLLKSLSIQRDDTILDIGAGFGYFTIPAAKLTDHTVYALDADQHMLDVLQSKLSEERIENVALIKGTIEGIPVEDSAVDHVIASMVMHELKDLSRGIGEIWRVLKPNGQCFCLELEPGASHHPRVHSSDMQKKFEAAGFTIVSKQFPADGHYLLIARK